MMGEPFEVVLCFFYMTFDDFHYVIGVGYIFLHIMMDYFTFVVCCQNGFFHHSFANGCHLRTVFGVDNGSNDVATECRTNLIKQVLVDLAFFLIFVIAYFQ